MEDTCVGHWEGRWVAFYLLCSSVWAQTLSSVMNFGSGQNVHVNTQTDTVVKRKAHFKFKWFAYMKNFVVFSYVWLSCMLNGFSYVQLFCKPMDCSPPGPSVHGILEAYSRVGCSALQGNLPDTGWESASPVFLGWQVALTSLLSPGKPIWLNIIKVKLLCCPLLKDLWKIITFLHLQSEFSSPSISS